MKNFMNALRNSGDVNYNIANVKNDFEQLSKEASFQYFSFDRILHHHIESFTQKLSEGNFSIFRKYINLFSFMYEAIKGARVDKKLTTSLTVSEAQENGVGTDRVNLHSRICRATGKMNYMIYDESENASKHFLNFSRAFAKSTLFDETPDILEQEKSIDKEKFPNFARNIENNRGYRVGHARVRGIDYNNSRNAGPSR